jgi:hypothetical protein
MRRRGAMLAVAAILLLSAAYRLYLVVTLPVGYDEVFVMAVGLEEMRGSARSFAFEVPVTRSSAVTPLWWWLQYVPAAIAGELSLAAMRVLPFVLGAVTLVAAYWLTRMRFGYRAGLIFTLFVCSSDVLAFTNSRAEFAESLTVLCLTGGVCLVGKPGWGWVRGVVWCALLMTSLGKGLLLVSLMVLAELVISVWVREDRARRLRHVALGLVIAGLPTAIWLLLAGRCFAQAGVIPHDAVKATGLLELIVALTLDYAQVKGHVTGSVTDAAFVWLHLATWPVTVMTALPLLAAAGATVRKLAGRRGRPHSRREIAMLGLLVWGVVGAALVIGRGTLGARFHLMYLPALWMLASLWLAGWSWEKPKALFMAAAAVWITYVGACATWVDWEAGSYSLGRSVAVGALLAAVVVGVGSWFRGLGRAGAITVVTVAALLGLALAGPAAWGPSARFEPMPGSAELTAWDAYRAGRADRPEPTRRTLFIDLANYYLLAEPVSRENLVRARHYARRETQRAPEDARAWAYLGEALLRLNAPVDEIQSAWQRSLQLAPNERLRRRLETLERSGPRSLSGARWQDSSR